MAKGKRKQKALADKRAAKEARMKKNGGESPYAKKRKYLNKVSKFGFQIPNPKPWKSE